MAEFTIQQAFQIAVQHHRAGQLPQAEQFYRQILAQQPKHAGALHYLGVIAAQVGHHDAAAELIRQAIAIKPNDADAHNSLGNVLKDSGQLDEAIAAFRQAITLNPRLPEAHGNLGNALKDKGQLDDAIAAFRHAIALKPDYFDAHGNLGNALKETGRLDEAITVFRQAVAVRPGYPEAHNNLGVALRDTGQLDAAIAACRQAIVLNPTYPEAHSNLGIALADKGQLDEAIAALRQAIALAPNLAEAHNNLGNVLKDKGQLHEAIVAFRQAIALKPTYAEAHSNLGNALKDIGQPNEAIAAYRQAIALKPGYPEAHSNLVFVLHYHPGYDAQAIASEHRHWNRQHAEPLQQLIQPHANDRNPGRRLRIGYVSPDFREHAVGRFLLPLLAHHDKSRFEVFAYAQVAAPDAMTQRLRSCTDGWRSMVGLSDTQAADMIRQDHIDILIDLAGHTSGNRLLVFARKPAPVQVTWLGYPDTTGLCTVDYRLTDALADPPGLTDALCTEQLIRLPRTAWCFGPPDTVPMPPRTDPAPFTFGSFNHFAKVTDAMLRTWARLLQALPEARLLLKTRSLADATVQEQVRETLLAAGVAPDRVALCGWLGTYAEHLVSYAAVDIALDTFPYNGTTTTCEALWMGVPVITLAGQTHVSRVGASLLSHVGLPELVARDPDDYVRIALRLAADRARLADLRRNLRRRMEQSPLMDAPRFAADIEAAFRRMWRTWCAKAPVLR